MEVLSEISKLHFASHAASFIHPYLSWPAAGLAITVLVASLSWDALERPALSLKRLVPDRSRPPARAPAAAEPEPALAVSAR